MTPPHPWQKRECCSSFSVMISSTRLFGVDLVWYLPNFIIILVPVMATVCWKCACEHIQYLRLLAGMFETVLEAKLDFKCLYAVGGLVQRRGGNKKCLCTWQMEYYQTSLQWYSNWSGLQMWLYACWCKINDYLETKCLIEGLTKTLKSCVQGVLQRHDCVWSYVFVFSPFFIYPVNFMCVGGCVYFKRNIIMCWLCHQKMVLVENGAWT